MSNEIDMTIADRSDEVPIDLLDEIMTEYQSNVYFDGIKLVTKEL